MYFLSEWNNGAIALLLSLFLIPVVFIFFSILGIVRIFPGGKAFLEKHKKQNRLLYYAAHVLLFLFLTAAVFLIINYLSRH